MSTIVQKCDILWDLRPYVLLLFSPKESCMASSDISPEAVIRQAAQCLLAAEYVTALTGAGISVESGIPPFRGPGGLWTKYGEPPMDGYQCFLQDPKKAWEERLSKRNDELFK